MENSKQSYKFNLAINKEPMAFEYPDSIDNPKLAIKAMREFFKTLQTDRENLVALYLDTRNNLIGFNHVSMGTLNSTVGHPREILKGAILSNANSIILCHNHPSGDARPSQQDMELDERMKLSCRLMAIGFLDNLILGHNQAFSIGNMEMIND